MAVDTVRALAGVIDREAEGLPLHDPRARRALARRRLAVKEPREWDVLLLEQGSQTADVPPLELHRAFVGRSGEFRVGP